MTSVHLVGPRMYTAVEPVDVLIEAGTVASIAPGGTTQPRPQTQASIDAEGLTLAPGFIDLQINGGYGLDLGSDPSSLWDLGALLPQHGVTSFLPTIISSPSATTQAALAAIRNRPSRYTGATPLGLHFEGPMLSPDKRGAHSLKHLAAPDLAIIEGWTRSAGVALVTIAPELPNALDVASQLVDHGVIVSAGHTAATSDETRRGIDAGITMVTHLFNAMSPLGHRSPNLVGVALADPRLTVGLIVDGVHIDPTVVAATWNAKGADGIALVTDAVAAMGQPSGSHTLFDNTVIADATSVRNRDGVLAGSVLTMDQAVRNLLGYTGCSPADALASASATPARILGATSLGTVEVGGLGDLVLLNDNLEVQITLCHGSIAFVAAEARHRVPRALLDGSGVS